MALIPTARIFDRQFIDQIPQITAELAEAVGDLPTLGRQWVFYGSRPLGAANSGSDLDTLLLHDEVGPPAHRRSTVWRDVPVTIYVLRRPSLYSDGADRGFGGYFALKLFSPFITDPPAGDTPLAAMVADFLAPLGQSVAQRSSQSRWNADQLLAHAHLAFLDMYPDAASYSARQYRHRDLFRRVWNRQRDCYLDALEVRGHIHGSGEGLWSYSPDCGVEDPARERARCAARFWAWAAVFHDADPDFPDRYFRKADAAAARAEQELVYRFLEQVAAGGALP